MQTCSIKKAILFLLFVCLVCISCTLETTSPDVYPNNNVTPPVTAKENVDVLLVMYMDGDNNLHDLISKDLKEAIDGVSSKTSNVEALILFDAEKANDSKLLNVKSGSKEVQDISNKTNFIGNEVNMASPNTLKNLLQWVKAHYSYKSIILQVSNHGGGPRSININNNSRLICQDATSNNDVLYSKDIPTAIKESNIGKVDLVIQDVCFGSAVEEVYEYKDAAKYMLLSPNEMPGDGLNYVTLLSCLNKGDSLNEDRTLNTVKFLYNAVSSFKAFYNNFLDWNRINQYLVSNAIEVNPLNMSIHAANHKENGDYYMNCPTITAIDVSHVVELKDSIKELVTLIKDNKSFLNIFNKKMYKTKDGKMIEYEKMIQSLFLKLYYSAIMYDSPVGALYDIGDISQMLYSLTKETLDSGEANPNYWSEFNTLTHNIITSLDNVVLASWRPGYETGALYEKGNGVATGIAPYDKGSFGLCVLGPSFLKESNGYRIGFDFNYKDYLSFNTDALWHDLMRLVINAK